MAEEKRYVYNPADADFPGGAEFTFNAHLFVLAPNAVNEIVSRWPDIPVSAVLAKCLETLCRLGVVEHPGPIEDAPTVKAAEALHEVAVRAHYGAILRKHNADVKVAGEHGLVAPDESDAVKHARGKLREWGLLAAATVLALFGFVLPAQAQTGGSPNLVRIDRPIFAQYNLNATSLTYCLLSQNSIEVNERILTAGSNTTVTQVSGTPFLNVIVGDELTITNNTGTFIRYVLTRASSTSITVDTALDITPGAKFSYKTHACGTSTADGWTNLTGAAIGVCINVRQAVLANVGVDTIAYQIEGRNRGSLGAPIILLNGVFGPTFSAPPAAASADCFSIADIVTQVRVGLKITGTDDGGDTGANREIIDVNLTTEENH